MSTLDRAIQIAAAAHEGQTDKARAPYILHCMRVMLRGATAEEMIVGVLHDVVEDTDWSLAELAEAGFSEIVIQAIDAMTRRDDEPYEDFVRRAARNRIARCVKVFDLEDNMDPSRLARPSAEDLARRKRYEAAHRFLTSGETR
ncbi:HD domain-containing protein [bacterium]|nr:HD domain-containing protein [bacterium]